MRISAALLCEFAQVRDRVLFVSSGAVSRFGALQFPVRLNAYVAVVLDHAPSEGSEPFEVRITLEDTDRTNLLLAVVGLQTWPVGELEPGESLGWPLTASLQPAAIPSAGRYLVRVRVPEYEQEATIGFSVVDGPV